MSKNSMALHMAHYIYMCKIYSWSNAVKRAWFFVNLREIMKKSVVRFSFNKTDGSIRYAKGTLHPILIPNDKIPKGDMSDGFAIEQYKTIAFFDLDKQEWRSFNIHNFICIKGIWQIVKTV